LARPALIAALQPLPRRSFSGLLELLFVLIGFLVMWGLAPHKIDGDGRIRYNALVGLMTEGRVTNIKCSYLQSVLSIPLYGIGRLAGGEAAAARGAAHGTEWWCAQFNPLVALAAFVTLYLLLRRRMPRDLLGRFLLLLFAASMLAHPLKGYYGEVLTAMFAIVGLALLACGHWVSGWLLVILGVVNAPACGIGMAAAAVYLAWVEKRLRHLLPAVIAAGLIFLERYLQTGKWFVTGYEQDFAFTTFMPYSGKTGFAYPLFFGLLGILFSFGKGLLFFAPGLFLLPAKSESIATERAALSGGEIAAPVPPEVNRAYRLWLIFLAGMILIYAKWWAWYGGWCWGPRFFLLAAAPASYALATRLSKPPASFAGGTLTLLAALLSFWVAANGAVFDQRNLQQIGQSNRAQLESAVWYIPEFSALWRPFVVSSPLGDDERYLLTYFAIAALVAIGPFAIAWLTTAMRQVGRIWTVARPFNEWRI